MKCALSCWFLHIKDAFVSCWWLPLGANGTLLSSEAHFYVHLRNAQGSKHALGGLEKEEEEEERRLVAMISRMTQSMFHRLIVRLETYTVPHCRGSAASSTSNLGNYCVSFDTSWVLSCLGSRVVLAEGTRGQHIIWISNLLVLVLSWRVAQDTFDEEKALVDESLHCHRQNANWPCSLSAHVLLVPFLASLRGSVVGSVTSRLHPDQAHGVVDQIVPHFIVAFW